MPKTPEVKQPVISWEDGWLRNMAVYVVSNSPEGVAKADAPLRQDVLSPQISGLVIILDTGESSDLTELSEAEARENLEGRAVGPKVVMAVREVGVGWKRVVPKHAPVIMLTMPHGTSCDWCHRMGRTCFSRRKGGQILGACSWCYEAKTTCKMGQQDASDAGSDDGQWPGGNKLGSRTDGKDEDGPAKQSPQLAAMHAQARLETYHMYPAEFTWHGANQRIVPMSALTGRKWVEVFMELPTPKWV